MTPFFSIGIVTYDRKKLLKECIASVLSQSFSDFEVIISNDFVDEKLSLEEMGIDDPRVFLINQPLNLGPWQNHNFTLKNARGKYFSWLSDDDLIANNFLEKMSYALNKYNYPKRVFSNYDHGLGIEDYESFNGQGASKEISGATFINSYLSKELKTVGHYGVFEREYLMTLGGLENLGKGIYSPYNDNLLAIRSGKLDRVVYIDAPLVYFRTHAGSSSESNINLEYFMSAQSDFLERGVNVILEATQKKDQSKNIFLLLKWCVNDIFSLMQRNNKFYAKSVIEHLLTLNQLAIKTGWHYWKFAWLLSHSTARHVYWYVRKCIRGVVKGASK